MNNITQFQKIRDKCQFVKDNPTAGLQCTYNGKCIKCQDKNCPFLKNKPPSFPMENQNYQKDVSSQAIDKKRLLTEREQEAFKNFNFGLKPIEIASTMNIKRQRVHVLLSKAHQKMGLTRKPVRLTKIKKTIDKPIRLHNDEIKTKANFDWGKAQGKQIKLKNTIYKLVQTKEHHIQLFKNNTITIRFLEDIRATTPSEAKIEANKRIYNYLTSFDIANIKIIKSGTNYELLTRHYGILGTNFAKTLIKEHKLIVTRDWIDNSIRERVDFSQGAEIDAEHIKKGEPDATKTKNIVEDWENRDIYLLSEVKKKIDKLNLEVGTKELEMHKLIEVTKQNAELFNNLLKKQEKKELKIEEEIPFERPSYIG